jgi:hypothetical protein
MRFLSIYKSVERATPPTQDEMNRMGKLIEEGMKAGWLLATEGCLPSKFGVRVRQSDGKATVTDGPFTESKELVGGFAILKANSKEEAIQLARNFLSVVGQGECELRLLYDADSAEQACAGKS